GRLHVAVVCSWGARTGLLPADAPASACACVWVPALIRPCSAGGPGGVGVGWFLRAMTRPGPTRPGPVGSPVLAPVAVARSQTSSQQPGAERGRAPHQKVRGPALCCSMFGGVLLSHTPSGAVPSALEAVTTGFGVGPGVTLPLSPPNKPLTTPPHHSGPSAPYHAHTPTQARVLGDGSGQCVASESHSERECLDLPDRQKI